MRILGCSVDFSLIAGRISAQSRVSSAASLRLCQSEVLDLILQLSTSLSLTASVLDLSSSMPASQPKTNDPLQCAQTFFLRAAQSLFYLSDEYVRE